MGIGSTDWGVYHLNFFGVGVYTTGPLGASTSQLGAERDLIEASNQFLERTNW